MNRMKTKLAVIPALAALGGAAAGVGGYAALGGSAGTTTTVVRSVPVAGQPAASADLTVNQIYRRAAPGVVEITVTTSGGGPFPGGGGSQQAQGSGFVYDADGHVITNQHVV